MAGARAEARVVDDRLRVLDAKADRERLGFHEHAALVQNREGVARAVAEREHDVVGGDPCAVVQGHAANLPGLDQHIGHALPEANFTTQRLDLGPHLLDHADEAERTDVRLRDEQDLFRRAGLHELVQHLAREVPRVADLAPQLAVGERAGAAFAELHVRLGVQHVLAPQAPGVLGALAHLLAALEHDRPQAHLREDQRGEDAARAEADHERAPVLRPVNRGVGDEVIARVGRRPDMRLAGELREHDRLIAQFAIDRVGQHDRALLARVVAALEDRERGQVGIGHAEPPDDRRPQRIFAVIERQPQFGDPQHRVKPSYWRALHAPRC